MEKRLREILERFRRVEWTVTNDPDDTDEKIEKRLNSFTAQILKWHEGEINKLVVIGSGCVFKDIDICDRDKLKSQLAKVKGEFTEARGEISELLQENDKLRGLLDEGRLIELHKKKMEEGNCDFNNPEWFAKAIRSGVDNEEV